MVANEGLDRLVASFDTRSIEWPLHDELNDSPDAAESIPAGPGSDPVPRELRGELGNPPSSLVSLTSLPITWRAPTSPLATDPSKLDLRSRVAMPEPNTSFSRKASGRSHTSSCFASLWRGPGGFVWLELDATQDMTNAGESALKCEAVDCGEVVVLEGESALARRGRSASGVEGAPSADCISFSRSVSSRSDRAGVDGCEGRVSEGWVLCVVRESRGAASSEVAAASHNGG